MKFINLFPILSFAFLICNVSAMSFDEELALLRSTGYRGDFRKIRSAVVREYKSQLKSQNKQMVGYLKEILDNVCYPVGLSTASLESSYEWCKLIEVADEAHSNQESDFNGFYNAVESILKRRGIELDFSHLFQSDTAHRFQRAAVQGLPIEGDAVQHRDLVSVRTLVKYDTEDVEEASQAAMLLANVLIRRLVVCLPIYSEIYFWRLKYAHSSKSYANFRSFEETLNRSLLEMRYEIRTDIIGGNSKKFEQWIFDNFIKVYEKLPSSRDIKIISDNFLGESVSRMGLTNRFIVSTLERLGRVILDTQRTNATYRERKPFIITYGISSDLIRRYLTLGLGWIVHEVSAYELRDSDANKNVVLGKACSWKKLKEVRDVSEVLVNKGWLIDTFLEDGGGKGTFLNNVLLIKHSERLLDRESVSLHGDIGEELSSFIKDLVSTDCTSFESPYLGTSISTEHLITIMASDVKEVTEGFGTIDIEDLRPSLKLTLSELSNTSSVGENRAIESDNADNTDVSVENEQVQTVSEATAAPDVTEEDANQSISFDECTQIFKDLLREQNKSLDEKNFKYQSGILIRILSGESIVAVDDFDCVEIVPFIGKRENFLQNRSSDSLNLIRALVNGFIKSTF